MEIEDYGCYHSVTSEHSLAGIDKISMFRIPILIINDNIIDDTSIQIDVNIKLVYNIRNPEKVDEHSLIMNLELSAFSVLNEVFQNYQNLIFCFKLSSLILLKDREILESIESNIRSNFPSVLLDFYDSMISIPYICNFETNKGVCSNGIPYEIHSRIFIQKPFNQFRNSNILFDPVDELKEMVKDFRDEWSQIDMDTFIENYHLNQNKYDTAIPTHPIVYQLALEKKGDSVILFRNVEFDRLFWKRLIFKFIFSYSSKVRQTKRLFSLIFGLSSTLFEPFASIEDVHSANVLYSIKKCNQLSQSNKWIHFLSIMILIQSMVWFYYPFALEIINHYSAHFYSKIILVLFFGPIWFFI